MCRSRAQGGQRCFAETERLLADADRAHHDTLVRRGPDHPDTAAAARHLERAHIHHASTSKGAANIAMLAERARSAGQPDDANHWRRILTRGAAKRASTDRAYAHWRTTHADAPPPAPADHLHAWATPPRRGHRCPACGQWANTSHRCPPAPAPPDAPTEPRTDSPSAAIADALYADLPLADTELADITSTYGTDDLDQALGDARAALNHPVDLYDHDTGSVDGWDAAAKRDAVSTVATHLRHVPDTIALTERTRRALADPARSLAITADDRLLEADPGTPHGYRTVANGQPITAPPAGPRAVTGAEAHDAARRDTISTHLSAWAGSYGADSTSDAAALHAAANAEFLHPAPPTSADEARTRAVLRAQYDATQTWLAARGITEVTVHRGMGWGDGASVGGQSSAEAPDWYVPDVPGDEAVAVPLNPLSSFSTNMAVAERFSRANEQAEDRAVLSGTVPASRILSTPRTGMGCLAEEEVIVLGGPGQWLLTSDYV